MNGLCRESERKVNWVEQAIELGREVPSQGY